jgi:hypothetical protein
MERALAVDPEGLVRVCLTAIHIGIGRRMNHNPRSDALDGLEGLSLIRYIQLPMAKADQLETRGENAHQCRTDHTLCPQN